jgi:hypothetical protein
MTDYNPSGTKHELLTGGRKLTEICLDGIYLDGTSEYGSMGYNYRVGLDLPWSKEQWDEFVKAIPTDAEITKAVNER